MFYVSLYKDLNESFIEMHWMQSWLVLFSHLRNIFQVIKFKIATISYKTEDWRMTSDLKI